MKTTPATTAHLHFSTHVTNEAKKIGHRGKKQLEQTARQEGIQADANTSRVMMNTTYAVTPVAKSIMAQVVIAPGLTAAQNSFNEFMDAEGPTKNHAIHYDKEAHKLERVSVDGMQTHRQEILNVARKENIVLRDDRFKDHTLASVNNGHNGTNVSINLSSPTPYNGMAYKDYLSGNVTLTGTSATNPGAIWQGDIDAFKSGETAFSKAYSEQLKKLDGKMFARDTLSFEVSGSDLNIKGFIPGATDTRESMALLIDRYKGWEANVPIWRHFAEPDFSKGLPTGMSPEEVKRFRDTVITAHHKAKNVEKLSRLYQGFSNPMNFARSGFRLMSMNMGQSEVVQGTRLAQPLTMGLRIPGKMLNATMNLSAEITRQMIYKPKAFIQAAKLTPKGAGMMSFWKNYKTQKDVALSTFKNPFMKGDMKFTQFMRQKAKDHGRESFLNFLTKRGLNNKGLGAFHEYFAVKNSLVKDLAGHGPTEASKVALKTAKKALRETLLEENLLYSRIANTKAGKAVHAVSEWFENRSRSIKAFKKSIKDKWENSFFGKLFGKITTKIAASTRWLCIALIILLAFGLLLSVFAGILYDMDTLNNSRERSYMTSYDQTDATNRGTKIMNYLKDCHNEEIKTLQTEQQKYNVADLNFPNGTKENYKEIYTMLQTVCRYDVDAVFDATGDDVLKYVIVDTYKKTHKMTKASYAYTDEAGVHQACHINLTVFRDDMGCYEELSNYSGVTASGGDVAVAVPDISGECLNADWSSVYTTVKTMIAQSGATYSQTSYQTLVIADANGEASYRVRQDCSGYVFACIRAYQHMMGLPQTPEGSSATLASLTSIPGFTRIPFNVNNLQPGDIIAKANEHAEIFAGSSGGTVYAYSNGCTDDMRVAGATKSVKINDYQVIWRCTGAIGNSNEIGGSTTGTTGSTVSGDVTASAAKNITETTGSHLNDISLNPSSFDEFIEYADNTMFVLGMSNLKNITFNEETGNQDGFETAMLATINTAKNNGYFTPTTFTRETTTYKKLDQGNDKEDGTPTYINYVTNRNHIPGHGRANSADYIRYLLAQHGVDFPFYGEYSSMLSIIQTAQGGNAVVKEIYRTKDLQAGDIIWYLPEGEELTSILTEDDIAAYSISDVIVQAGIEAKAVPLLYLGDGQATAFSKDITKKSIDSYEASEGKIRTYSLSDLNKKRIVKMYRYDGYTINPVWGSNEFFAGWTDVNVSSVLEAQNQSIWQGPDYTYTNSDGKMISYKSFYNGEDFFAQDVYETNSHDNEFKTEMLSLGLKYYDVYGILPSTLYTHAAAASNSRTTEESLKAFDVFEKTDNSENGLEVEKYEYDSDGKPTLTRKKYKQFANLEAAVLDLFKDFKSNDGGSAFAETFTDQYSRYKLATGSTKTLMKTAYNSDSYDLDQWDQYAVSKKKSEDAVTKAIKKSDSCNYNRECTEDEHNDLQSKYDALKSATNDLNKWFSDHSTTLFGGYTNSTSEEILSKANARLTKMETALAEQKAYLEEQATKRAILAEQNRIVTNINSNRANVTAAQHEAYGYWGYSKGKKVTQEAYNKYYEMNQWLYLSYCDLKNFVAQHPDYEPTGSNSLARLKAEIDANNKELKQIKKDNKLKKAPGI